MGFDIARAYITDDFPARLTLKGECNFRDAPSIRRCVEALLDAGNAPLRVDARDLDFIDSSGLSALIYAANRAGERGTYVSIIGAHGQLRRLLRTTGLERLFRFEDPNDAGADDPARSTERPPAEIRLKLPCDPAALALARDAMTSILRDRLVSPRQRDDLFLATGEAVANAVQHACPVAPPGSGIDLRIACENDRILVEVTDRGPGFDPDSIPEPDVSVLKDGGMGIFFMRSVMDTVDFHHDRNGTTVRMEMIVDNRQ